MEITSHPPPPTGVRRMLLRLPIWLYRLNLGWLLGHRFVLIGHIGRKSGKLRHVVVEVVARDPESGTVTVASGFGPGADWYRNLLARPEATVELGNTSIAVRARPVPKEQGGNVMLDYARRHRRAARSLSRFMGFGVDGTDDDYRAVGREVHFLRLEPVTGRNGAGAPAAGGGPDS